MGWFDAKSGYSADDWHRKRSSDPIYKSVLDFVSQSRKIDQEDIDVFNESIDSVGKYWEKTFQDFVSAGKMHDRSELEVTDLCLY